VSVIHKRLTSLPCPFCGSGMIHTDIDDEDFDVARAFCGPCGSMGPFVNLSDHDTYGKAEAEACRLWDTRASKEAALLKALEIIARGDTDTFDEDLEETVVVSMDADEMRCVAEAAINLARLEA
jgi:ribosomal protein S27AE